MRAHVAHHDGVAVGLGLRAARDAGRATGAGDVLDHELLAERARHVLADDAGDDVGRPAGGERHDHGDWTLGVGGMCAAAERERCDGGSRPLCNLFQVGPPILSALVGDGPIRAALPGFVQLLSRGVARD